jgi:transposase-like protein
MIDASEATVWTDGWQAYDHLASSGVEHRPQVQGSAKRAATILPWIHIAFSNLKTWLRGTFHGVSRKHLPRYLQEFTYRFDRRARESELFPSSSAVRCAGSCSARRLKAETAG